MGACCSSTSLTANVLAINSEEDAFPERQSSLTNGMCVSGGGARALSFSLGVYRALANLGVTDALDCISSVSGGTWASSIFMFAMEYQDEPIDTPGLLGAPTIPEELSMDKLNEEPAPLGIGATADATKVIEQLICCVMCPCEPACFTPCGVESDEIWIAAVAKMYLEPFGLANLDSYLACSDIDVERIKGNNPHLTDAEFLVPRADRPRAFVINGTVMAPLGYTADDKAVVALQISPDYTGSPFYPDDAEVTYRHACNVCASPICTCCDLTRIAGGGLIETFAFGGKAPSSKDQQGGEDISVGFPPRPLSLATAAGISSFAPGGKIQICGGLGRLVNPQRPYWPVTSEIFPEPQKARTFELGDGGELENSGLLALLQRKVKRVIWVANAYRELNSEYDYSAVTPESFDPNEAGVIDQLFDKFGYGTSTFGFYYSNNQVFPKELLLGVAQQLTTLKNNGKPAVVQMRLEVLPNSWWGIKGGYEVEIVLIYLDKVADFEKRLPKGTQHELEKGADGLFATYPIYKTSAANLENCQVNLLAAQGEFCVKLNQSLFQKMARLA